MLPTSVTFNVFSCFGRGSSSLRHLLSTGLFHEWPRGDPMMSLHPVLVVFLVSPPLPLGKQHETVHKRRRGETAVNTCIGAGLEELGQAKDLNTLPSRKHTGTDCNASGQVQRAECCTLVFLFVRC